MCRTQSTVNKKLERTKFLRSYFFISFLMEKEKHKVVMLILVFLVFSFVKVTNLALKIVNPFMAPV